MIRQLGSIIRLARLLRIMESTALCVRLRVFRAGIAERTLGQKSGYSVPTALFRLRLFKPENMLKNVIQLSFAIETPFPTT